MLAPGRIAGVVLEGAVGLGDRGVVGLDAALHLLEQLVLQRLARRQQRLGVGVLSLQVGPDVRLERGGIAQHLAPVVVLHPGIVVHPRPAELFDTPGFLARDGGRGCGLHASDSHGQAEGSTLSGRRARLSVASTSGQGQPRPRRPKDAYRPHPVPDQRDGPGRSAADRDHAVRRHGFPGGRAPAGRLAEDGADHRRPRAGRHARPDGADRLPFPGR